MIAKSYIERNLRRINRLYAGTANTQDALFYSKLATLELCGWIEVSMDEMVLRTARRLLKSSSDQSFYKKKYVKKVYGFEYNQHIRPMLIGLIGVQGVVKLENRLDPVLFDPMRGALTTLKPHRDTQTHEYIKGATLVLDAPSVTLSRFKTIYEGLTELDRGLRLLK